ncbi:MAG TPA: nickel pincer cofactor biosynthesis protein LarC [Vulgatibacter sp.]|nr:nickel pincer cofactor biosynthesis protein LarC [Vulgatibacter sp.]
MSRYLIMEPVGGCSGDMTLAALLDLGAPLDAIGAGLDRLGLGGWSLEARPASKCGIGGTRVDVRVEREDHARSWREIRALIEDAGLPAGAASRALAIFERIAAAEAHVHGTTPERVHFHEVGAVDSIVDVVGVSLALDELGVETIHASPPPLGSGIASSQHGPIPVPAPATLEILRGRPVRSAGEGERTTPTGAAILAALTRPDLPSSFVPERVGYGIGHRDFPDAANVLRAVLAGSGAGEEDLLVIECNLDDASPQVLARAIDAALEAGALDAWVAPVTMKKGRPAHLLGLLAPASLRESLAATLFRETPTLGLRHHAVERDVLERRFEEVETAFGPVRIKVGFAGSAVFNAAPEWDDCVAAAARAGVAPRRVREEALAAWLAAR